MFCKKCGAQLQSDARICPSCGDSVGVIVNTMDSNYDSGKTFADGQKSVKYSLIFGIVSLCCFGFIFGVFAIVFGIRGYKQLKSVNQPVGLAIAGIVFGVVGAGWWLYWIISGGFQDTLDMWNSIFTTT